MGLVGLIQFDRKEGWPAREQSRIKTVRLFRDFAVTAVGKIARKGSDDVFEKKFPTAHLEDTENIT